MKEVNHQARPDAAKIRQEVAEYILPVENFEAKKLEMIALATAARDKARAEKTQHRDFYVGSAMLDANGRIFFGANQKRSKDAMAVKVCAEREVMEQAIAKGDGAPIVAIVVVSDQWTVADNAPHNDQEALDPCGSCQRMLKTEPQVKRNTILLTINDSGENGRLEKQTTIEEFLPDKQD